LRFFDDEEIALLTAISLQTPAESRALLRAGGAESPKSLKHIQMARDRQSKSVNMFGECLDFDRGEDERANIS
jgi:hypothetical protein